MAASTKLKIAALSLLGSLFVLGFLFLFLRSSGDTPLELTDIDPAAVATMETTETVAAPARPGYATAARAAANNRPEAAAEPFLRVYISGAVRIRMSILYSRATAWWTQCKPPVEPPPGPT